MREGQGFCPDVKSGVKKILEITCRVLVVRGCVVLDEEKIHYGRLCTILSPNVPIELAFLSYSTTDLVLVVRRRCTI